MCNQLSFQDVFTSIKFHIKAIGFKIIGLNRGYSLDFYLIIHPSNYCKVITIDGQFVLLAIFMCTLFTYAFIICHDVIVYMAYICKRLYLIVMYLSCHLLCCIWIIPLSSFEFMSLTITHKSSSNSQATWVMKLLWPISIPILKKKNNACIAFLI